MKQASILQSIEGTGKDGRITKGDVLKAQTLRKTAPPVEIASSPALPVVSNPFSRMIVSPVVRLLPFVGRLLPVWWRLSRQLQFFPPFNEVDLSAVMALRKSHQDSFVKANGVKLGFMSFFVKAVVHALKAVPGLNVRIEVINWLSIITMILALPWVRNADWLFQSFVIAIR